MRQEFYRSRTGRRLNRVVYAPDGLVRAGAVLVHGLGEHAGRYAEVAHIFTSRGIVLCGVDLPGSGRSGGRRGDMRGLWEGVLAISECAEHLDAILPGGAPKGIAGHSFGAFLSLAFLRRFPGMFRFGWLSSPLLEPARSVGKWKRRLALAIEPICPWARVDNGVRSEGCTRDPGAMERLRADPLMHRRVSLRVGRMLMDEAPEIMAGGLAGDFRLLVTQGLADPVCPPDVTRSYFDSIGVGDKELREFEGLLHEPFRDIGGGAVLAAVGDWLDRILKAEAEGRKAVSPLRSATANP